MLRLGIVGTNWITKRFVDAAHESGLFELRAVYSRRLEKAQAFAKDYPSVQDFQTDLVLRWFTLLRLIAYTLAKLRRP